MYDANLISELEVYKHRYLLVFLGQTKREKDDSMRENVATVRFYILEPEREETEIILGANFVYLRDKDSFELRMERAIPYKIIDSYTYDHTGPPKASTDDLKKILQTQRTELVRLYQEIIELRIKEREIAGTA